MALPTLFLTRPEASAQAFAKTLAPDALAAVHLIVAPLMEIVEVRDAPALRPDEAVIFTSQNGVRFGPDGEGRTAFCVGAQTTQAAIARGWKAEQAGSNAAELIATLGATRPEAKLCHLGGKHTIGDIAQTLSASGIATRHAMLYEQRLLPLSADAADALSGPCIAPVFSPRSAEHLVHEAKGRLENVHIVALSASVAAPFDGESTASCLILPTPEAIYMRKVVENLCLSFSLP